MDNSIAVSHTFGNLSVEGVLTQNIPVTSNGITSVEGDENLVINHTGTFRQFTTFDISPLGGVKFAGLKFNQSALREIQHAFVTFSAWITHYLPILISLWFISLVVSDCDILLSLIEFFAFVLLDRISWITIVLLGVFHFQTAMDSNTGANNNNTNDSFEQLLNQYLPVTQTWFSSDRARPRFRAGAVRPRRSTTVQRGEELKSQYARILANFRTKRARKTTVSNLQSQSV